MAEIVSSRTAAEDAADKTDDPLSIDAGQAARLPLPRAAMPQGSPLLEAALPLLQGLDPQRVQAIRRSVIQLETLRQEGVVLAMPELMWE